MLHCVDPRDELNVVENMHISTVRNRTPDFRPAALRYTDCPFRAP